MGSGKSTILKKANVLRTNKYTVICDDFDVLGCNIIGADSLSHYKKSEVLNSLKFYLFDRKISKPILLSSIIKILWM